MVPFVWAGLVGRHAATALTRNFIFLIKTFSEKCQADCAPCAMSSLDEIQSLINSAKDELAESRKLKEQVEHETVQAGETQKSADIVRHIGKKALPIGNSNEFNRIYVCLCMTKQAKA